MEQFLEDAVMSRPRTLHLLGRAPGIRLSTSAHLVADALVDQLAQTH